MQAVAAESQQALPPQLASWLLDSDSLTLRLKTQCRRFEVLRLREWHQPAQTDGPGWRKGELLWHREVLLRLDDVPWVHALTEVPLSTLRNGDIDFQSLGERPLGEVLFSRDNLKLGPLTLQSYGRDSRPGQLAEQWQQPVLQPLWGRTRQFFLSGMPLRITETFFPAVEAALQD